MNHPLGTDPGGTIVYTPEGHVSAQLMRRDRPRYDVADVDGGTSEQTVAAASGYLAYSGPYSLDESTGEVRHHVEVSLLPNWIGGTQLRKGRLDGPTLVLTADITSSTGITTHSSLVWRRRP